MANKTDEAYINLVQDILANGIQSDDRTGVGTISVFGRQLRFNLTEGFPILTTKSVPFRWVFEELMWFLSGSVCETSLRNQGVDIWKEWATAEQTAKFGRSEGDLGPIYGHQWRNFAASINQDHNEYNKDGIDQIANLIKDIETNPSSRRLIVSGWNPKEAGLVALPPCHTLFQMYVRNNTLSCQLYQRSCDVALGLPFNIASYALLTHMVAHVCNLKVGEFIHTFGDVHIYNNHVKGLLEQTLRKPYPAPTLTINENLRGTGFNGLLAISWTDVELNNYQRWPKIEFDVAV